MFDADLPDAFERELAAVPGAATARDVLDVFIALAREPITSDEEASVEYEVVRIEVVSGPEPHAIVLKREIAYLESTPDGDANVFSYFMVDVTVPRALSDTAGRSGTDYVHINYDDSAHPGRDLDLDEVVAAARTHPLTAELLERAVLQWRCWLDY